MSVAAGRTVQPRLDQAFAALADASRRDMIRALLHKPLRAGELARSVRMTPQALSRHLRVLRRAGLVREDGVESDARVRIYRVRAEAFDDVQGWLSDIDTLWRHQLQAFKTYAESPSRSRKPKT